MIELICDHAQKISPIAISPDKLFGGIRHVYGLPDFEAECQELKIKITTSLWAQNGSDTGMKLAWFDHKWCEPFL